MIRFIMFAIMFPEMDYRELKALIRWIDSQKDIDYYRFYAIRESMRGMTYNQW